MIKRFDSKTIHMHLKRNGTTVGLMEKYGFTSPEELYEALRHAFPKWEKKIISELRQNDKAHDKHNSPMPDEFGVEVNIGNTSDEQDVHLPEEDLAPDDMINVDSVDFVSGNESINLQSLLDEEQSLLDFSFSLETKHKKLISARTDCIRELQQCRTTVVELQRLIQINRERVNSILADYDNLAVEMKIVSEDIATTRSALESVQEKIRIAKKANVYVFEDGAIEVENADIPSTIEIADFSSLVQRQEAEDLTIREIKAIAKLIHIVEWLQSKEIPFEISFDSEKIQLLYEAVMV